MGNLKQGATYIYERADGVTYAREFGSTERTIVGWDFDAELRHELTWKDIHKEAKTNPALQKAIDRVIMIYKLGKEKYE